MSIPNQTSPDLISALSDEDGRLSAMEEHLAELVLADMTYATNTSITEIAARAGSWAVPAFRISRCSLRARPVSGCAISSRNR